MPQLSRIVQRAAAPQQACFRFLSATIGVALALAVLAGSALAAPDSSGGGALVGRDASAHVVGSKSKAHRRKAKGHAKPKAFIEGLHGIKTVASTIPANGDVNPYALLVAPISAGKIVKGDLLVDNFNDKGNDQGTGSTIVQVTPQGKVSLFTEISRTLAGCPGGVGLTTAMTVLANGDVIVGSAPSTDGTTKTAGAGCLVVLSPEGMVLGTIAGPNIDGPWDMTTTEAAGTATLFVDNVMFGVGAPGQGKVNKGTVLRIGLSVPASGMPTVTSETVIASGLTEEASAGAFVIGPTGLVLEPTGTLYVADRVNNRIESIPDATTRTESDSAATVLTSGHMLEKPLGMTTAPNGDLLVVNAENGKLVEISTSGKQLASRWLDKDEAQSPPGSGDLFGVTSEPGGKGIYFVRDDNNTLDLLH
ncbi:MAG: hypothetical protein WB698_15690 [Solirubrobacteraceae bacterium]